MTILDNESEWCEQVSWSLLTNSKALTIPINVLSLLVPRNIISITVLNKAYAGSADGALHPVKNGFVVGISNKLVNNSNNLSIAEYCNINPVCRYILCHEIAHTFFYDLSYSPPILKQMNNVDSKKVEKLCDLLARAILLPRLSINHYLSNNLHTNLDSGNFFSRIELICKKYNTPLSCVLVRLIQDLKIFNYCIFEFVKFKKADNSFIWRLVNQIRQDNSWNKSAFVPLPNNKKSTFDFTRYVSSKNNLSNILDHIDFRLDFYQESIYIFKKSELSSEPLNKFIEFYFTNHDLMFGAFKSKWQGSTSIRLCFSIGLP